MYFLSRKCYKTTDSSNQMAKKLVTRFKLTRVYTQKGQRSNWCRYAENAYTYNHFLSLTLFVNLILNVTNINRQSVMQRTEDCHLRCVK